MNYHGWLCVGLLVYIVLLIITSEPHNLQDQLEKDFGPL